MCVFTIHLKNEGNIMTKNVSYSQLEKKFASTFSKDLMLAESTEDVRKFFSRTIIKLISQASDGKITPEEEDISLTPSGEKTYSVDDHLTKDESVSTFWHNSDIHAIIERFALKAIKSVKHLDKHPEKDRAQNVHHLGGS